MFLKRKRTELFPLFLYQNKEKLMFPALVLTATNVVCDLIDGVVLTTLIAKLVGFQEALMFSAFASFIISKCPPLCPAATMLLFTLVTLCLANTSYDFVSLLLRIAGVAQSV
jgi:hypothetical protein